MALHRSCRSLLGLLLTAAVTAQSPVLIADIRATFSNPPSSAVRDCVEAGGLVYFTAVDPVSGPGLFCTDGTAAGTRLLRAFPPAEALMEWATPVGNELWFVASDTAVGRELWRSDGTPAGTVLVADIRPGAQGSFPERIVDMNGTAIFFAQDDAHGFEPWVSQGTPATTMLLRDIEPGIAGMAPNDAIAYAGSLVFFDKDDGTNGRDLWVTDGTPAGTQRLDVWALGPDEPRWFCDAVLPNQGHRVYFSANGPGGRGIYSTDGTAQNTQLVVGLNATGSAPAYLTAVGNRIYFSHSSPGSGSELWSTDGTAANTAIVTEIEPGAGHSFPRDFVAAGNTLYFAATTSTTGKELYSAVGGVVTLLGDLATGFAWSNPRDITPVGNDVYFSALGSGVGRELYYATPAAATLVRDVRPIGNGVGRGIAVLGTDAIFAGDDGVSGVEPWRSDGTTAGTQQIIDLSPGLGTADSSAPRELTADYEAAFFSAEDDIAGRELWRTDGVTTTRVADIAPFGGSDPRSITRAGRYLYFTADDGSGGTTGRELWRVDGAGAASLVADIVPGAAGSDPDHLTDWRGRLAFVATTPATGSEVWVSDGTAAGTTLLADVSGGSTSSDPDHLVQLGEWLCFAATRPFDGRELIAHDGASFIVLDIEPFGGSSSPADLCVLGDRLVFAATTTTNGRELWISDLTGTGTFQLADIQPGAGSGDPTGMTYAGGRVWFVADDGVNGTELWATDGTLAGTQRVADLEPGAGGATIGELVPFGDRVLFVADTTVTGPEVFVSDGTAAGTELLVDSAAGVGGVFAPPVAPGTRFAYFWSQTAAGSVLYRTGGTPATTTVLPSGGLQALAMGLVHANQVMFVGDDGTTGAELWGLDVGASAVSIGAACAAGRGAPRLLVDDPVVGTIVNSRCEGITAGAVAWLLLGLTGSEPMPVTNDCLLLMLAGTAVDAGLSGVVQGEAQFSVFVPNSPVLLGIRVANQAAITPTPHPDGWDLSNGVITTVGN